MKTAGDRRSATRTVGAYENSLGGYEDGFDDKREGGTWTTPRRLAQARVAVACSP